MLKDLEDYSNFLEKAFLADVNVQRKLQGLPEQSVLNFTFQVTDACNLRCTYCYQAAKQEHYMSWPTAKAAIDYIFSEANKSNNIFSYDTVFGIIFEFIGGEPLLNVGLIKQIIQYIESILINTNSPWLLYHRYSISTNGTLYFTPEVQDLIHRYSDLLSISVTVDGIKELHDNCRIFPDGRGSYDLAVAAALDQLHNYNHGATKMTLCPDNIQYLYQGFLNMMSLGYTHIWGNCVFEEGWTSGHALIYYNQIKQLADYIIDNNLQDQLYISLFDEDLFRPMSSDENENFCGGTGRMVSIDYNGPHIVDHPK